MIDPACGSGNFLTETYISLRKLENEAISLINQDQIVFDTGKIIKVKINQFYGIEINDFAVTVAKTALWIAESQMMKKTEEIVHANIDFLPLTTNAYIVEGNALQIDWNDVVPTTELNYIMGNPPFVGARLMEKPQKDDLLSVFGKIRGLGDIDYVSGWYKKADEYTEGTRIETAFVSTNSISQGEQPSVIWSALNKDLVINFAHRTFRWDSEANAKAHVHCVIIGFSHFSRNKKLLFDRENYKIVDSINAYLLNAPNVLIASRNKPICDVPTMDFGSMANDKGYLSSYSKEDKEKIVSVYPKAEKLFKRIYGADEFINNRERWCLWLKDVSPLEYIDIPPICEAIKAVEELRLNSTRAATQKLAETPMLFGEIRQPENNYLLLPRTSSENRRYIPIGFVSPDFICSDANILLSDANLYQFGVLTSNVHMAWMRAVAGRLEMRYRYSIKIVYNNFPWCKPTEEQKLRIEQTAQAILDARQKYSECSFAQLYGDKFTFFTELVKAHQENDKAVMQAYGFTKKHMTESECVAELMKMYKELVEK